jgi:quinoprotein glucose dehydrogenase
VDAGPDGPRPENASVRHATVAAVLNSQRSSARLSQMSYPCPRSHMFSARNNSQVRNRTYNNTNLMTNRYAARLSNAETRARRHDHSNARLARRSGVVWPAIFIVLSVALASVALPSVARAQRDRSRSTTDRQSKRTARSAPPATPTVASGDDDWPSYGRDPGGSRYSPLAQINRTNVSRLQPAWRFSTGEARPSYATDRNRSFEDTPLVIAGTMFVVTPLGRVFALDASTGRERWRYNASVVRVAHFGDFTTRGVSYWRDPRAGTNNTCKARIVFATIDARLIALDAATGAPCQEFGDGGTVDLRVGLHHAPHEFEEYEVTSPPAVVNGMLVVGSAISDNGWTDAVSGEARGYDARTGALVWTFDPVPRDEQDPAYSSWQGAHAHRTGAANAWSVITADTARGLVFLPTSSPSPDYFGGERLGDNKYANSVVALSAATGKVVWSFQTVHHDLWDYDNPAPPALVTVRRQGRRIDAVLEATKTGMLFVLDRETGAPIVPVDERAVPPSSVPGEVTSPTQPFSRIALSPQRFDSTKLFALDSADRRSCRDALSKLRYDGPFTPPSLEGTLALPSNIGGAHWGGVAFDPARQLAIVPVNNIAAVVQLIPRATYTALVDTLHDDAGWAYAPMRGTPYGMRRTFLLSTAGVPCTLPPFGSLVAANVETGTIVWSVPLGSPRAMAANRAAPNSQATGVKSPFVARIPSHSDSATGPSLGSVNLGGAIVTGGGLAFIGATLDRQFRAFDIENGRELWSAGLPAGGKATPMTYRVHGRQYVAIAAGGDGGSFGKSDEIVVFALPSTTHPDRR